MKKMNPGSQPSRYDPHHYLLIDGGWAVPYDPVRVTFDEVGPAQTPVPPASFLFTQERAMNGITRGAHAILVLCAFALAVAPSAGQSDDPPRKKKTGVLLGITVDTSKEGVVIGSVNSDSAAGKAGLKVGDAILSLGGKRVESLNGLRAILSGIEELTTHELLVRRNGEELKLSITFGKAIEVLPSYPGARGPVHAGGDRIKSAAQREQVVAGLPGTGVKFLLKQQKAEGRWAVGFQPSADPGLGASVGVTALVCMALLEHFELFPEKIKAAIDKGLVYLKKRVWKKAASARDFEFIAWGQLYTAVLLTRLSARAEWKDDKPALEGERDEVLKWMYLRQRRGPQFFGSWGYRNSFHTAAAILGLVEIKEAGVAVADGVIENSAKFLKTLQIERTWRYSGGGRPVAERTYRQQDSAGRLGLCALASFKTGAMTRQALQATLETFMTRRAFLDKQRGRTDHRQPADLPYRLGNATPYCWFFHFGYYYTTQCLRHVDRTKRKAWCKTLREDLHGALNADGTWTAFELRYRDRNAAPDNKVYATALSLMALKAIDAALAAPEIEPEPEQQPDKPPREDDDDGDEGF
jgi:hypothetical protein